MRKVFCIEDSFKAEIHFYEDVIPTLQNFRRKFGLNEMSVFARYYGSRLNLNGSDIVDKNGVILLENLKTDGKNFFHYSKGHGAKVTITICSGCQIYYKPLLKTN